MFVFVFVSVYVLAPQMVLIVMEKAVCISKICLFYFICSGTYVCNFCIFFVFVFVCVFLVEVVLVLTLPNGQRWAYHNGEWSMGDH